MHARLAVIALIGICALSGGCEDSALSAAAKLPTAAGQLLEAALTPGASGAAAPLGSAKAPKLTLEKYNAIQLGMSYAEVAGILGFAGVARVGANNDFATVKPEDPTANVAKSDLRFDDDDANSGSGPNRGRIWVSFDANKRVEKKSADGLGTAFAPPPSPVLAGLSASPATLSTSLSPLPAISPAAGLGATTSPFATVITPVTPVGATSTPGTTHTVTATATPTATATATATPAATATLTPTATPRPTSTPTIRPTETPTPRPTATPTPRPTPTPQATATPTPRPTATPTPRPTATPTPRPTATPTPRPTATPTPRPTATPTPQHP